MNKQQRLALTIKTAFVLAVLFIVRSVLFTKGLDRENIFAYIFGGLISVGLFGVMIYFFLWGLSFIKTARTSASKSNDRSGRVEDALYEQVAKELQERVLIPGLWAKAYAEANGEDTKARAYYIKYRVAQLAESKNEQAGNNISSNSAPKAPAAAKSEISENLLLGKQPSTLMSALLRAADSGDVMAQNNLGHMFEYGQGIEKNYEEAMKWYKKSASQGSEDGIQGIKRVRQNF